MYLGNLDQSTELGGVGKIEDNKRITVSLMHPARPGKHLLRGIDRMPTLKAYIVGRQAEMAQFAEFAACRTSYRVLNYYGPAGIGKTVLCQMMESFCRQRELPFATIQGDSPDITPDRLLYYIQEGLIQGLGGEKLADTFGDFRRRYEDYLIVQEILQRGGGLPDMFDVVGNVKDPVGLTKTLAELGKAVSEGVRRTVHNRFALERYLRGVDKALTNSLTDALAEMSASGQHPIILLFDTYEELEGLDDWICRGLVRALPDGVKLVIFGRNQLHRINFDWSTYGDLIHAMELPELSEADAKAYLVHYGLRDTAVLDEVYRFTGGYPLLLVLVVHLARESGRWEAIGTLERIADRDFVATQLLNRILREERVHEVRDFLERGCIARWFDPEVVSVIMEVDIAQGRAIYEKLRHYSFIQTHPYGLKFHDRIRELLLEQLMRDERAEYQQVAGRLMAYYAEKAGIALPPSEERPEAELPPEAKYTIRIEGAKGIVIGDQAWATLNLAEMLAFGSINAVAFSQDFGSLLGLSRLPHDAPYRPDVYPALFDATSLFSRARSLAYLPFLFIRASTFLQTPVDELRQYLHQVVGPAHRRFVFIYWTEPGTPEQAASSQTVVNKLQQVWAYDCVLLGREELQKIVFSADPKAVFRKLVLSQVDLTNITPFITGGPILTEHGVFFGREKELREITEHVATASYAVIGGRRIGKTSILKRLEGVRLPAAGFRSLYHDCSFTPTQAELVQAVVTDKTWFPESCATPPTSLFSIVQALLDDKPLVILLDEADKLIAPDRAAGYPLLNALRALANTARCRFVLSGERALRAELTNPNSPLYNFAKEMLIGRLDFRAVEELVTRPMKQLEIELANEAAIVQHIWDFTSGHPNVVQRLCQRLIALLNQRGDRRLTLGDIEAVVSDPDFLRKDFLNIYWERATALERLCSLMMAADDSVRTLTAVHEALSKRSVSATLNEVDDALERLVDLRNILQCTAEGYEFAVAAFPEVIAKTARLDDLMALNRETYQRYGDVEPRSKRGGP